jgi:hypothetical protein
MLNFGFERHESIQTKVTSTFIVGLFSKKDYVKSLLYENDIDILNLQETELGPKIDLNNLNIKGYVLEVETNEKKKRVATYIKTSVQYKRRNNLEKPNLHLIKPNIQASPQVRIITLYRKPLDPKMQDCQENIFRINCTLKMKQKTTTQYFWVT